MCEYVYGSECVSILYVCVYGKGVKMSTAMGTGTYGIFLKCVCVCVFVRTNCIKERNNAKAKAIVLLIGI